MVVLLKKFDKKNWLHIKHFLCEFMWVLRLRILQENERVIMYFSVIIATITHKEDILLFIVTTFEIDCVKQVNKNHSNIVIIDQCVAQNRRAKGGYDLLIVSLLIFF